MSFKTSIDWPPLTGGSRESPNLGHRPEEANEPEWRKTASAIWRCGCGGGIRLSDHAIFRRVRSSLALILVYEKLAVNWRHDKHAARQAVDLHHQQ